MFLEGQQKPKRLGRTSIPPTTIGQLNQSRVAGNHDDNNSVDSRPTITAATEGPGVNLRKPFLPVLNVLQKPTKKASSVCHWSGIPVTQAFRNSWASSNPSPLLYKAPLPRRLLSLTRLPPCTTAATTTITTSAAALVCSQSDPGVASFECHLAPPLGRGKHRKALLGEFTHVPSAGRIFAAKPKSFSALPPLQLQAQSQTRPTCNNLYSLSTNRMTTHEAMRNPTVLVEPAEEDCHPPSSPECELPPPMSAMMVRSRPPLVHTVSIVIEPVVDSMEGSESDEDEIPPPPASPQMLEEELEAKQDLVKTVMDAARLRKEEFARLLEEHAQIVHEINRAENSLIF